MTVGWRVSAVSSDVIHDAYGHVFLDMSLLLFHSHMNSFSSQLVCVNEHVFAWCPYTLHQRQRVGFLPSPWCCVVS